jgi:putative membrane protein
MSNRRSVKVLLLALLLAAPPAVTLGADTKSTGDTKSSSKLSSDDSNFIKDAAQGGMLEVELGKLAQQKGSNDKVKEFGKRMEQDHSKANEELKKIAADKGVQLTALDKKHQSKVDKLSKASAADFDRNYMKEMVDDHKDDVSKFQKQADKGKDADLKQFASSKLPTLKEHLQLAQSTEKAVREAGKSGSKNTASNTSGMGKSSTDMGKGSTDRSSEKTNR